MPAWPQLPRPLHSGPLRKPSPQWWPIRWYGWRPICYLIWRDKLEMERKTMKIWRKTGLIDFEKCFCFLDGRFYNGRLLIPKDVWWFLMCECGGVPFHGFWIFWFCLRNQASGESANDRASAQLAESEFQTGSTGHGKNRWAVRTDWDVSHQATDNVGLHNFVRQYDFAEAEQEQFYHDYYIIFIWLLITVFIFWWYWTRGKGRLRKHLESMHTAKIVLTNHYWQIDKSNPDQLPVDSPFGPTNTNTAIVEVANPRRIRTVSELWGKWSLWYGARFGFGVLLARVSLYRIPQCLADIPRILRFQKVSDLILTYCMFLNDIGPVPPVCQEKFFPTGSVEMIRALSFREDRLVGHTIYTHTMYMWLCHFVCSDMIYNDSIWVKMFV